MPQQYRDGTELVGRVILEDQLEDPLLVFGVLRRIHQGHDDGFRAVVDEFTHRLTDVVLVEGHHDLARGVDPLAHRSDELAVDQRFRALRGRQVLLHGRIEAFAVAAATRHAIALGLISADEADAVWAAVAGRHPDAEWCRAGPRLAA